MRGQYPSRARGGISIVKRRAKRRRRDDLGTKKEGAVQNGVGLEKLHVDAPFWEALAGVGQSTDLSHPTTSASDAVIHPELDLYEVDWRDPFHCMAGSSCLQSSAALSWSRTPL